jgi:hypothetical protein
MVGMERQILPEMMKTAQRTTGTPLPDGDDAACRDVVGKDEAKTSPKTRTTRLAIASPVEMRNGS